MFRCPRCCKAGESQEEIQGACVDKQTIGCPDPVEVTPGKDVVLACRREMCGKTFSFPARLIPGRGIPTEISCMWSPCEILVVNPSAPAPKEKPQRGKGKA